MKEWYQEESTLEIVCSGCSQTCDVEDDETWSLLCVCVAVVGMGGKGGLHECVFVVSICVCCLASSPGLSRFCSSVCIQYNTQKQRKYAFEG